MNVYYPFNFCSLKTFQNNLLNRKRGKRVKIHGLDRLVITICCGIAGKLTLYASVYSLVKSQIIIIHTSHKAALKIKLCKRLIIMPNIQQEYSYYYLFLILKFWCTVSFLRLTNYSCTIIQKDPTKTKTGKR